MRGALRRANPPSSFHAKDWILERFFSVVSYGNHAFSLAGLLLHQSYDPEFLGKYSGWARPTLEATHPVRTHRAAE